MAMRDLGPAERFAAGALGRPGARTFYLEVTANAEVYSFVCEKSQVADLAERGLQLLVAAGLAIDEAAVEHIVANGLEVSEPVVPVFRVTSIAIAVIANEFITLVFGSEDPEEEVRFIVTAEQFRAMALVAAKVVAAGRPICPRCQLPMDPDGHRCPSNNGHHV